MASLLLIEDEETLAKNIARFLEHSGWDVEIAGTAEEGLKRVAALAPDVILLDFSLPRMDGLAALSILRERGADSRLLAAHFLEQFGRRYGKPALAFTAAAQAALCAHDWPGNVRELRNTIEQAVLTARDEGIDAEDLLLPKAQEACRPFAPHGAASASEVIPLASMECELITQGLHKSGWNVTRAAGLLGISRDTLRYRMERYQLLRPGVGQASG